MSDVEPPRRDEPLYKQLTHEVIAPSSKWSVMATIFGAILVTVLINFAALWYLEMYPANRGYWLVKQKWDMLLALEEPVEWLILGDSSGNQGIVPEVLVGDTAVSAVNLSTVASLTMLDDVWMLQLYIDKFGPPERVLVVHTYDMWVRNVIHVFLAKASIPWGAWDNLEPAFEMSAKKKAEVFLTRYAPIYAENQTLSNVIYNKMFGPGELFKKRFRLEPTGHMSLLNPNPANVVAGAEKQSAWAAGRTFKMSAVNRAAMEQMIALAEANQLDVYMVNSPLYEGLVGDEAFQPYYAAMQDSLRGFAAQSDYVHFLDMTAVFPADEMENVDHVIESAAIRYTQMVADAIADVSDSR